MSSSLSVNNAADKLLPALDKNICHESLCEQICTPVPADFMLGSVSLAPKCSCEDGYVLNDDKMSCRRPVEDSDRYLLYVDHNIVSSYGFISQHLV